MKSNTITIGNIAKQSGISPKTIRYYEEIGLIDKAKREKNKYRIYDSVAIKELILIKHARDSGLPISEIRKLMKGCENGDCAHTKEYVTTQINSYVSVLKAKIKQLQMLQDKLMKLKTDSMDCTEEERDMYCCNLLSQLLPDTYNIEKTKGGD